MADPGIHHAAYTCRDLHETHHFYAELLGLELVHPDLGGRGNERER